MKDGRHLCAQDKCEVYTKTGKTCPKYRPAAVKRALGGAKNNISKCKRRPEESVKDEDYGRTFEIRFVEQLAYKEPGKNTKESRIDPSQEFGGDVRNVLKPKDGVHVRTHRVEADDVAGSSSCVVPADRTLQMSSMDEMRGRNLNARDGESDATDEDF